MVSIPLGTQILFLGTLCIENRESGISCGILNLFVSWPRAFRQRVIFENTNLLSEAPVVQKLDSAIQRKNHYPADKY